jgi:dTMP kinase
VTFIAFEGGEATGKSTQAARLALRLGAVLTREPGGTAVGEHIRDLLLDPAVGDLDPKAEFLLMAGARAQHVAEVVAPALADGRHVVTDRFTDSSLAYQGYARGLDVAELRRVSDWAAGGLRPNLVVLLTVPDDVARARLGALDRFESEAPTFHQNVLAGYAALAQADPERWVVVDGSGPPDDVEQAVWSAVSARLSA